MKSLRELTALTLPIALAACSTTHEFRVAAVGDSEAIEASSGGPGATSPPLVPGIGGPGSPVAGGPGGGPGTGGSPPGSPGSSPPVIVVSGNVLLGPSGQLGTGSGSLPGVGIATGTVSAVLLTTSQTVVQLADGATVLVNGIGGMLGDSVSIDLAQGQVIGGSAPLVGSSVPGAPPAVGSALASAPTASVPGSGGVSIVTSPSISLPSNAGKVLSPATGVATVIQPLPLPPPPTVLPVGQ